ncbi:serpin-ZX-like [Bidens hawaiensis]|uniref:serpin-ZX-like n=1 Tax=Bidens hawaiensis TaxID=980011 RepID=UPI00404A9F37
MENFQIPGLLALKMNKNMIVFALNIVNHYVSFIVLTRFMVDAEMNSSTKVDFTSHSLKNSIRNQAHVSTTLAAHLLSNKFPDKNVVFSPLSIHVVLSLLTAASNGPTLNQLLTFLKTNTTEDLNSLYSQLLPFIFADKGGTRVCFTNGVWIDKTLSLKPSFKQLADAVYKADCNQVDFRNKAVEVVNEVNLWAEKQTHGLIKQVISANAVNPLTWLIFANAIYFKGSWDDKFQRSRTKESDFQLLNGNKVQVPFMTHNETQLACEHDDFKVLGLPYLQNRKDTRRFTMYFFLPNAKDGVHSLIEKISSTSDFIDRHIPIELIIVNKLLIPKFNISFGFEASGVLKELGVVLPFSEEGGMTEMVDSSIGESVYGRIHHKCVVNVDEDGTKAGAVSAFLGLGCGMIRLRVMGLG